MATYVCTVAGSTKTLRPGWTISETINGRSLLTAEVLSIDGTYRAAVGAEVNLTEDGIPIFGGHIDTPSEAGIGAKGDTAITTRITAVDYNALADRRFVVDGGFPAGWTLEQALDSLVGYLTPYGVTVDAAQATGPVLPLLVYDIRSVTSILDELSVITNYIWRIDYNKKLRMYAVGDLSAAVSITQANRFADGDVTVEPSRKDYANRILLLAGTGLSEATDDFTGNGAQTVFTLTYWLSSHRGYVTNDVDDETLGAGATWTYDAIANTITRSSAPANLNAISITYIAQFPYRAQADDAGEQAANGLWEKVITAPDTFSAEVAQALADGYLARAVATSQTVRYVTRQLGVVPGKTQTITVAKRNLSGTFLITDVQTTALDTKVPSVRRTVTATGGTQYQGSWRDTFKSWSGGSSIGTTVGATSQMTSGGGASGSGTTGNLAQWTASDTLGNGPLASAVILSSGSYANPAWVTSLAASKLTGTIPSAVQDNITRTGVLVAGATGAGFTVALTTSTLTGNLPYARMPSGAGTWTAIPTISGALTLQSTLGVAGEATFGVNAMPLVNYLSNLGSLSKKYLSLHAAELWVETLVAQNTIATIGGRILVAPTTTLMLDLAPADTTIRVKHNQMVSGDRVHMEANGSLEWMAITSGPSAAGGGYEYTVTRNLDASGANQWYAGDAVLNTGTTGDGFIDLFSIGGILGTGIGPTIVGNVRTGTTYSNIEPRWAIGNLNGFYGYVADTYGAAFGTPSAAWIKIDPTNGIRIGHNATNKITLDASGNATFAGTVTAAAGDIAGWSINADSLRYDTGTNATSAGMMPTEWPFYAGATYANRATAPFRVSNAGALTSASGNIALWSINADNLRYDTGTAATSAGMMPTEWPFYAGATFAGRATAPFRVSPAGAITSTSGAIGGWTIDANNLYTGSGATRVGMGSASTIAIWAGSNTDSAAPFRVTNAGALTATNATITGNITATSGDVLGALAAGSITAGKIATGTITATQIATGTITATQIAAGTITADKLNVSSLSAITADLGSVNAGQIVVGGGNKLWLNDSGDGVLAIGGGTKASAPFYVTAAGVLKATSAELTSIFLFDGMAMYGTSVVWPDMNSGSTKYLLITSNGTVFASSSVP